MPAVGLYTELERMVASLRPQTRYQDLELVFRRLTVTGGDPIAGELITAGDGTVCKLHGTDSGMVAAPLRAGSTAHLQPGVELRDRHGHVYILQVETIARFGGRWDHHVNDWAGPAEQPLVFDLQESQVEYARWFATWHHAFKNRLPRDTSAVVLWGDRRGGKTWITLMMFVGFVLDLPRLPGGEETVNWVVSITIPEREELDRYLRTLLPEDWYVFREQPKHEMILAHGGKISCLTVEDPETLKRGEAHLVLLNEGAKMSSAPFENALPATRDRGGLLVISTNPPTYANPRGFWIADLKEAHDEADALGKPDGMRFFTVSSIHNVSLDSQASERVAAILRIVNPERAEADAEGRMIKRGDRAFRAHFQPVRHLKTSLPLPDITALFTRQRVGRAFPYLLGSDFNAHPAMSGVVCVVLGTIEKPVLWALCDIFEFGDEDDLVDALERFEDGSGGQRFTPNNVLIVADSSAAWQSPTRQPGKTSEAALRNRGYTVVAPQEKRTAQGMAPKNPPIILTTNRVQTMLDDDRWFVHPDAKRVQDCLRNCAAKKYGDRNVTIPTGKHVHIADCVRYLTWYVQPSRRAPGQQAFRAASLPAPRLR